MRDVTSNFPNDDGPAGARVEAALAAMRDASAPHADHAKQDAAWARLQARLHDPARIPFTDDGPFGPTLVTSDATAIDRDAPSDIRSRTRTTVRTAPRLGWSIAAALMLAAGGLAAWGATPVRHEVARGGTVTPQRLPDGTTVWVAAGSALSYPRRLAWPTPLRSADRSVALRGTAFFAVARDGRPFIIHTPDATVQVLGTRFEVRAAEGQHGSRVQVEEGKVAVTAGRGRLVLTAGQGARVTPEGLQPQPVARQGVATWRTGGLAALDEPISAVLEELARRFSVEITTDATVDARTTVSLFYPTVPGVERVLSDLCAAQNLSFIRTSRGFRVQGAVRAP
ncbi:FecR family protein [Gemmatimonas sp.]|uniref:FecR family protein n=1 Tax=Gemmatimonas sp. TaxID=1962908 RepID=UPI0037BF6153